MSVTSSWSTPFDRPIFIPLFSAHAVENSRQSEKFMNVIQLIFADFPLVVCYCFVLWNVAPELPDCFVQLWNWSIWAFLATFWWETFHQLPFFSQILAANGDWQQEALLDNEDFSEEAIEPNERDHKSWWQAQVKLLRRGLGLSIEAVSRAVHGQPREYSINEDFSAIRPDLVKSPAAAAAEDMSKCSPSQQNDWPLSPLMANAEDVERPPIVIIPSVSRNVADTRRIHQPTQRNWAHFLQPCTPSNNIILLLYCMNTSNLRLSITLDIQNQS